MAAYLLESEQAKVGVPAYNATCLFEQTTSTFIM